MPAYSFKERFVPLIISGAKKQTIRKKRKGQAKEGSTVYLYYGLRTKQCYKITEATCTGTKEIRINKNGSVFIDHDRLTDTQKDLLAYQDGFRNSDFDSMNKTDSIKGTFDVMLRWWKQTHELPFVGDIIYW